MSHLLGPGDLIGDRYEIDKYIGEGGMQEVYKATDLSLSRVVALKAPKNSSAKKRFQRSASVSAKVTHPNVAKTLDYIIENGAQYLVEEFCSGNDLKTRFENHYYYLDPHLAAHVFHHFIKGLAAVHGVGVLHRDLKPSNIMVSCDADITDVKITDFGISKMAESEIEEALQDDESTLASNTLVGALPYMAPEMISNSKTAVLSADVWSAGAILYQLLTGELPFGGGVAAVSSILSGVPPNKPALFVQKSSFRQLSDELWEIIIGCLKLDPVSRPTAAALVDRCSQLCYSSASRFHGVVTRYGLKPGSWGFIDCNDIDLDAFFHAASFWGSIPQNDTHVSVGLSPGSPQPRAFPVLPLRSGT